MTPSACAALGHAQNTLTVGSDADVVLFDPDERWTIRAAEQHSRVDYSLFEGFEVQGRVKKTFLRGRVDRCKHRPRLLDLARPAGYNDALRKGGLEPWPR